MEIITPYDELMKEAKNIDNFLTINCSELIEEIVERGNTLAVYIARTGKMVADAKYHLNEKKKSDIVEMLKEVSAATPFATSKAINGLVDSICKKEQYLVDWIERLNRASTHQLDWCRTLISKEKEEMKLRGFQR